jgi:hypothetical protein
MSTKGKQLLGHSQLLALGKPYGNYVDSLSNWMDGMKPVVEEESHFLEIREDLVPLSAAGPGNRVLEKFLEEHCTHLFTTKVRLYSLSPSMETALSHVTQKHQRRTHAAHHSEVAYYSTTTISRVVRAFLLFFAVIIIIGPTFALYFIKHQVLQLTLIGVFAFIFALALSLWTESRNYEIFAAIAA